MAKPLKLLQVADSSGESRQGLDNGSGKGLKLQSTKESGDSGGSATQKNVNFS